MSKRYPDFADGTNLTDFSVNLNAREQEVDSIYRKALESESFDDALKFTLELPEMDYHRRLSAFTNLLRRFEYDSIHKELADALMIAMNENALNLAAKTLPLDIALQLEDSTIPIDDIGFSRPPAYNEAMAVADCWDITQDSEVFLAAHLMFEEITSKTVEQDIEALTIADNDGMKFTEALRSVVQHQDLEKSGYYAPLDD